MHCSRLPHLVISGLNTGREMTGLEEDSNDTTHAHRFAIGKNIYHISIALLRTLQRYSDQLVLLNSSQCYSSSCATQNSTALTDQNSSIRSVQLYQVAHHDRISPTRSDQPTHQICSALSDQHSSIISAQLDQIITARSRSRSILIHTAQSSSARLDPNQYVSTQISTTRPSARGSDVVEEEIQQRATVHQQMLLELAIAKRCRLHKLVRQRFDFAHIIQQDGSYNDEFSRMIFAKRFSRHEDSAVARFSRKFQQKRKRSSSRLESAGAKQLTTYEELRELNHFATSFKILSLYRQVVADGGELCNGGLGGFFLGPGPTSSYCVDTIILHH
ncbi:arsenite-antimonite efflux family [Dorcoceras hygrometricum]|uniref:Arsenite-antimonite efflux family n=1 Tax=Dorcoceras hygrometricum TaxID=472368 RepID=A0A2Z7ADS9_9LAMI|nr:arsenite-antimonite efflux family [Dorcoceras hygrometricum]